MIHVKLKINFILDIILSVSVTKVLINYFCICKLFQVICYMHGGVFDIL